MEPILKRLEAYNQLDNLLELDPKEYEFFLIDILNFANNNKTLFINFCRKIEPTQHCILEVIYEAIVNEPDLWGDFLYEEFKRIFNGAKSVSNPFHYTSCLDIGPFLYKRSSHLEEKIVTLLSKELDSPIDALRHRALWFLADWIDDEYHAKYKQTIDKMAERIHDNNWKIRFITLLVFKERAFAKNYRLKLSFWDTFKGKNSLFFSSPYDITE